MTSVNDMHLVLEMALTELESAARAAEEASESCAYARDVCLALFEGSGNAESLGSIPMAQTLATQAFELRQGVNDLHDRLRSVRWQL